MKIEDIDRAYLWHPFTPMVEWLGEPPLVIDRAEGNELIDTNGRRYLDGVSSLWVNVHGHRHPHIDAAIRAQLDRVAHSTLLGLGSTPAAQLAQRLVALAPSGITRVFLSDSGSTAVEVALKIAFQFHALRGISGKTKFITLTNAYHGDTMGSVSLGGMDVFHRIFHPLLFATIRVPPETAALERAIAEHAAEVAAVIVEPLVQGAAGMHIMPPGLLRATAAACRRHGVLLIADEVATGFGRTGTMFACEQEGVTPDLMCLAKGLTGGYLPVAATLTTDEVFNAFLGQPPERLTFFHGHSYGGNALGCAAAIASLEIFEQERTLEKLPSKIALLARALSDQIAPLRHVFEIRQKGMMVGIELRREKRDPYAGSDAIGARACRAARRHGVILRPLGDVVVLMPPLAITPREIGRVVDAAAAGIEEATENRARPPRAIPKPDSVSPRGLFITGTDTSAGKTTVAAALLRLAVRHGARLVPFKPVETGCAGDPQDACRLRAAANRPDIPLPDICPFALPTPAAPAAAAAAAGVSITLAGILCAARELARQGDALVVEGAGGLLSPYSADLTGADIAAALGFPLLLVARNALGAINHTALAIAEIRRRRLPFGGLILVDTTAGATPDRATNAALIESLTGVRALGTLPFVASSDIDALADALARTVNIDVLLDLFRLA